jgi:hypothetical protein
MTLKNKLKKEEEKMKFYDKFKKTPRTRLDAYGSNAYIYEDNWMDRHPMFCGGVVGFVLAVILFIGIGV